MTSRITPALNHTARILISSLLMIAGAVCPVQAQNFNELSLGAQQGIISDIDQQVSLRDGTTLNVQVFRPRQPGTYPTLYASSPLPLSGLAVSELPGELGPVAWYVSQGYAVVIANTRGTGGSEGEFEFLSRNEQQDHYEVIDWISNQPWSNQRVGGYGSGYSGTTQWQMSTQFSSHLDCIAPHNGSVAPYRDLVMPGGLRNQDYIDNWYEAHVRDGNAIFAKRNRTFVSYDLLLETRRHALLDEYWQERSPENQFNQINVPVFILQSLESLPAGNLPEKFENLQSNWKLLIAPQASLSYTDVQFHARELLPFYNYCLKDQPAAYSSHEKIRYAPGGLDVRLGTDNWPPDNTRYQAWNLNHTTGVNAGLLPSPVEINLTEQLSDNTLTYYSDDLSNALALSGHAMLELYFNAQSQDTAVRVRLYEELATALPEIERPMPLPYSTVPIEYTAPEAVREKRLLSSGILRASMRNRQLTEGSYNPQYSFTEQQALLPGQRYRLDIAMQTVAHVLRPGSRLVLEISLEENSSLQENGGHQVLYGTRNPSRLWLPVNDELATRFRPVVPATDQDLPFVLGNP